MKSSVKKLTEIYKVNVAKCKHIMYKEHINNYIHWALQRLPYLYISYSRGKKNRSRIIKNLKKNLDPQVDIKGY
jgi:hypothetical protein